MVAVRYSFAVEGDPDAYVELHEHADGPERRHNVRCDVCRQLRPRLIALGYVQVCGHCIGALHGAMQNPETPTST